MGLAWCALAHQVDGADDSAYGDLHDGARHECDKEADEQKFAEHLHELPPDFRRPEPNARRSDAPHATRVQACREHTALGVVLAVEEADGA